MNRPSRCVVDGDAAAPSPCVLTPGLPGDVVHVLMLLLLTPTAMQQCITNDAISP